MTGARRSDQRGEHRVVHQVASWCLSYPDDEVLARRPDLVAAVSELPRDAAREGLDAFLTWSGGRSGEELRRCYVETFDLNRRHAMHLSYWTDGDTRRRGSVLHAFKQRYRGSTLVVDTRGELPDHLPLVLEYAAVADPVDGPRLLQEYRPSIELLRLALLETGSDPSVAYAAVVAAVCATLPGPSPADRMAAQAMAEQGPPAEQVGLDAYDPRLLALSTVSAGSWEG